MSIVSASQCFATTLHLKAYNEGIPLNEVIITFTGKFAKAPILGITEGDSGLYDPAIELSMESSTSPEKLEEIAKRSIKLSPVLSNLKEPVQLVIK